MFFQQIPTLKCQGIFLPDFEQNTFFQREHISKMNAYQ